MVYNCAAYLNAGHLFITPPASELYFSGAWMRLSRLLPTLLLLAFSGICQADLQVLNGTPQRNNRYYIGADKSFLGQPYNWSGVSDGSATMWATMISPSYFLSAQHIYTNQTSVTFYEGNDSTNLAQKHTYTIASHTNFGDLFLGKLSAPIPAADHITYYPILSAPFESDYLSRPLYVYGQPNSIGENNISGFAYSDGSTIYGTAKNTATESRIDEFTYNVPGGYDPDEAYVMPGDSGAPSFAVQNGALALVGIHYVRTGTGVNGDFSGDTFVPHYITQLASNMGTELPTVVTATAVPEPAALGVLTLAGLFGIRRRLHAPRA